MAGYSVKEDTRYSTRLAKNTREQVNLCGACGDEIAATELLCVDCRGDQFESVGEEARRTR